MKLTDEDFEYALNGLRRVSATHANTADICTRAITELRALRSQALTAEEVEALRTMRHVVYQLMSDGRAVGAERALSALDRLLEGAP